MRKVRKKNKMYKNSRHLNECPICHKYLQSLGMARHRAMHADKARMKEIKADFYKKTMQELIKEANSFGIHFIVAVLHVCSMDEGYFYEELNSNVDAIIGK